METPSDSVRGECLAIARLSGDRGGVTTTATPPGARERYRDALAVGEYRAILASFLVTMAGMIVAEFATSVLIYRRTGSPLLTTMVMALAFLPYLFGGTLLTSLVDRVPSRRLLIASNVVTAAIACAMSVPGMPVAALLGLVFCDGVVASVFAGTRAATLPDVLPDVAYVPGRSLFRLVSQLSQMGGLAVGGVLLTFVSAQTALRMEAVAFLASGLILRLGTAERRPAPRDGESMLRDSLRSLRTLLALRPTRRVLMLSWLIPMLADAPEALAVPYSHERGFGTAQLGLMMAALPLGNMLSEPFGVWALSPRRQVALLVPLAAVVFVPFLGYGMRPAAWAVSVLLLLSGFGFCHHLGLDRTFVQVTPEELRPGALSLQTSGMMFFQGIGFLVPGAAAQFLQPSTVVVAFGLAGLGMLALLGRNAASGGVVPQT
jgi:hypothetical protein